MHTSFGGCDFFGFGDIATFKNGQISLSTHGLYSPWSSKNSIDRNRPKKIMQVGIDVTYMHTNFGGCDLSDFGDTTTFKKGEIPLQTIMSYTEDCLSDLENFINIERLLQKTWTFI